MLEIALLLLVVLAILAVQTNTLRRAIVYLCVFSLLCSFCYLLYQAPDVAIAEAVIGSTLSTIIYLVALNKYKVFRVYYIMESQESYYIQKNDLCKTLAKYSYEKELELDIVNSNKSIEDIVNDYPYDIIVLHSSDTITVYGDKSNYHFDDLIKYIGDTTNIEVTYDYLIENEGDTLL
ncbi:hypothetical protein SH1V18_46580 [Vallitalea longa]|uniref:MrpA C-terminal/MbhD domain-containing protein n=1 Tax=Vallitalea longa TaxID=2936439 RepID=A0A9W6DI64_9FIRM|nr:DUF4040 domain-containing protein [Vallitalea longa]GKX32178.1 hypothetical protein SH1V18_46580 [Vallitalea longa]